MFLNDEIIKKKAYEIYLWRLANRIPGTSEEDWKKAEEEIKMEEVNLRYTYFHYPEEQDGTQ